MKYRKICDPAKILTTLHQEIVVALKQKQSKNNNGMDIALVRIQPLSEDKQGINFCGAKRPLHYIKAHTSGLLTLKETRKSIGGI